MTDNRTNEDGMETAVIRALERKPKMEIPEDFAMRVARALPAKTEFPIKIRPVFARTVGYFAAVAMTAVLLVLTKMHPQALEAGRGFVFAVEALLLAQLLTVGLWLGTRSDGA